jgi:hypothetical protein
MRSDWRPPIGTLVRARGDSLLREVVAHFTGDGYGECLVIKRPVLDGWKTEVVMRSIWERSDYIVVFSAEKAT